MIDKKEENKELLQTPGSAPQAAPAECPPVTPCPPGEMSKGEKWYNRIVYQGINYWVNLGLSLYIADLFLHGGGKLDPFKGKLNSFFESSSKRFSGWLNAIGLTNLIGDKGVKRATEVALGTFTLNSGGNVLLIPMKIAEDRKRPIVHWLNKYVFGEKQLAPDGHEETPEEIYIEQEQPHQSWMNVIKRRILAITSTIASGLVLDWALRTPQKDGQEVFTDTVVGGANYVLNSKHSPDRIKALAAHPTAQRYMGYAALDTIYTAMTAAVMYMTNGARKGRMPKEIGDEIDPPVVEKENEIVPAPQRKPLFATRAPLPAPKTNSLAAPTGGKYTTTIKPRELGKPSEPDFTLTP